MRYRRYHVACGFKETMARSGHVTKVDPADGIFGGEVTIDYGELSQDVAKALTIRFDDQDAHIVAASGKRALAIVPELNRAGEIEVSTARGEESKAIGKSARFIVGKKMAGAVHQVTNPAFDPADGSLFVTRSGSRGERVPVSLYRIGVDENLEAFSGDITNPTSIAFD